MVIFVSIVEEMAGRLLREARQKAGLTQVQLAERAGVTQSVISAYESGRRQPGLPMLVDLVRATGLDLVLEVQPRSMHGLDRLTGPLGRRVRDRREEIKRVAEEHGALNLRLFGSVARGEERQDSDVDLLTDLRSGATLLDLAGAANALEDVIGAPVDLVPSDGLKADVRETIAGELVAL